MIQPLPFPAPVVTAAESLTAKSLAGDSPSATSGVLVVFAVAAEATQGEQSRPGRLSEETLTALDETLRATIGRLIDAGEITGVAGELVLLGTSSETTPLMLVVGAGPASRLNRAGMHDAAAAAVRRVADKRRLEIVFLVSDEFDEANHDALVAGAVTACEGQHLYQSQPSTFVPERLTFVGLSSAAVKRGEIVGSSINHTRRLVNEPPTIMNPSEFADRATAMADAEGLQCEVWDEEKLEAEGCRAILAVGRASTSPPRLVILKHNGGGSEPPVAIVGKGVTFDSGGLSIKPSDGMVDMKCDMAGAATVVGVMRAIARLGLKRNVIGLCGLAENMISGDAYKLGDVIETRSGKTIEILNTDAEGRVVLADTLDVAVEHNPSAIVDLATLTGACMVALGNEVAGVMTNDPGLCEQVIEAAGQENEPVWQLPMFPLYNEKVKSKVADIKNVGDGRWGGAITAAKFLEHFVKDVPWVHIDIAGPAFTDSAKPARDAGATGVMVRSLVRWLEAEQ